MSALARRLATRLGCTEGQAWTLVLGLLLATLVIATSYPGVLRSPEVTTPTPPTTPTVEADRP